MTTYTGPSIPLITSPQPTTPSAGQLRFNTTTNQMETYNGSNWNVLTDIPISPKLKIAIGRSKFGDCHYWVEATACGLFSERYLKNIEIDEWVVATYGPKSDWGYGRWCASDARYWFKEEKDRDWFILRWTE